MQAKDRFYIQVRSQLMRTLYAVDSFFGLNKDKVTIFCYHSISKKSDKYSVDFHLFKKGIEKILRYSKFIAIEDVIKTKVIGQSVVLTVDDGYKDVLQILPFTKKYKIPVAIFVLAEPECANREELMHGGKFLSWNEIKMLHKEGWTIGCHSATHANFASLSNGEVQREIIDAKKKLEKSLGIPIQYFAYPKGTYTDEIIKVVKKAGYKAAFSVYPSNVSKKMNIYTIPRVVIDSTYTDIDFPALYGNTVFFLRRIFGKFAWNLFLKNIKGAYDA